MLEQLTWHFFHGTMNHQSCMVDLLPRACGLQTWMRPAEEMLLSMQRADVGFAALLTSIACRSQGDVERRYGCFEALEDEVEWAHRPSPIVLTFNSLTHL